MELKIDLKSVLIGVGAVVVIAATTVETDPNKDDFVKTIDVTGSAELDVIPDDVEIKFTYTEWLDKSGKKSDAAKIDKIEPIVIKSIVEAGIAKKDIKMANVYGNGNYYYYKRYKRDDHVVSKTLSVCISKVETINKILDRFEKNNLDERAMSSIYVGEKDHIKMTEFRKKVKTDAIKAAKAKAKYLLEAIGQTPGDALTVKEVNNDNQYRGWWGNQQSNYSNAIFENTSGSTGNSDDGLAFSPINLRYEIQVTFEIN